MLSYFKGTKQEVTAPVVRRNDDGTFTLYTVPNSGTYAGQALRAFTFSLAELQWLATQVKTAPIENLRPSVKKTAPAPAPVAPAPVQSALAGLDMELLASYVVKQLQATKPARKAGK